MTAAVPTYLAGKDPAARRRSAVLPTVFMIIVVIYCATPLLWLLVSATKSNDGLFNSFGFWFADDVQPGRNLHDLFAYKDGIFIRWMLNTLLYSAVSAGLAAIFATIAGYTFSLFTFKGKNLCYVLILGSIMVPTTALAIPTYALFTQVGIVDTPTAVILPSLLSPFGFFLIKVYADSSISRSVVESARIDGASELRIFVSIAFRILMPAFVTVLLFAIVTAWNNYFVPLVMLNTEKLYTVVVGLAQINATANAGGGAQPLFNLVTIGSLVAIVPPIIAFILLQRYWESGLSSGSVNE
ncbi:carbohydrate ABC transporter permease [Microlunatus soli]|uniref:Multiple sugar transport system permease protein n=1 Tax=Microlunatus soli TaxID=630515 RepID=A0A1H1YZP8_9ACTN|nr:carbohydrate ABC transporter permease [Microlunatus soli]SDT26883.1 multiple sugar transport system permease protein [Microlunatus soli]